MGVAFSGGVGSAVFHFSSRRLFVQGALVCVFPTIGFHGSLHKLVLPLLGLQPLGDYRAHPSPVTKRHWSETPGVRQLFGFHGGVK